MIRTVVVTLAALATIDHLVFAGKYAHLARQVADNFIRFMF
jgi:hypothetical protein